MVTIAGLILISIALGGLLVDPKENMIMQWLFASIIIASALVGSYLVFGS